MRPVLEKPPKPLRFAPIGPRGRYRLIRQNGTKQTVLWQGNSLMGAIARCAISRDCLVKDLEERTRCRHPHLLWLPVLGPLSFLFRRFSGKS